MQSIQIRPFRRSDREQLTALVNAHVGAVMPGVSVSVNGLMNQLEREPDELIVDPWVVERRTLVALERDAVVAGAHLLRYAADERVSDSYRNSAEIRWLVFTPHATAAADRLLAASLDAMREWRPSARWADGSLPAPGCYGVPVVWPHVRAAYARAGFAFDGRVELLFVARIEDLPSAGAPPLDGLAVRREVGRFGTQFVAVLAGEPVGVIDVEVDHTAGGTRSRLAGWSDIGTLHVDERHRRRGVGTWLVGHAADWLRLSRTERVLAYASAEQDDAIGFLNACRFRELTRVERGWSHP